MVTLWIAGLAVGAALLLAFVFWLGFNMGVDSQVAAFSLWYDITPKYEMDDDIE